MPYPTTYPDDAADQDVADLSGAPCPRLTAPGVLAERLAELDRRYICDNFVDLDQLVGRRDSGDAAEVREQIARRALPQPAYRLDDGTDMVPSDYFALVDAAGSVQELPAWFGREYAMAAATLGLPDDAEAVREQWEDYLSGGYFVCLRQVTPSTIAQKARHIETIEALLSRPDPDGSAWGVSLRDAVEALSALERPGAILDPPRWGGPMSPQWYGTYLRTRYPQAFAS